MGETARKNSGAPFALAIEETRWISAAELAALELPGLPASKQHINRIAAREGWRRRRAVGRKGGGFEYATDSLPEAARLALASRRFKLAGDGVNSDDAGSPPLAAPALASPGAIAAVAGVSSDFRLGQTINLPAASLPGGSSVGEPPAGLMEKPGRAKVEGDLALNELPAFAREAALGRAEILRRLREYARHAGCSEARARAPFADLYNRGALDLPEAIRARIRSLSAPNLKRWRQAFARGGIVSLAPGHGNRRGCGAIGTNPAMRDLVLAMLTHFGAHLRIPRVVEALAAKFPDLPTPSNGAVRRFVAGWRRENPSLALAVHNPDRWKGRYRVKIADAGEDIVRLNQEWQIDGTPADVMLTDGRYHVLAIIDVYSRRTMFHVAPSEGTQAAIRLICRAMLAWGVPERIHGDNGSGFISHRTQAFLDELKIQYIASPPFRPETKSFVESVIGVMSHQLIAMLPGFIGHNVAQRQELRARTSFAARFGAPAQKIFQVKLTAAELQARLDTWADAVYGDREHSGLAGKTPNQVAAEWNGEIRKIGDERALEMLAEDGVVRVLGREGVAVEGARFVATAETIGDYVAHIGERAIVYPDPRGDMGRYFAYLDSPGGRQFVAVLENIDRLGHDRSNLAMLARAAQDRFIRERRAEMRRVKARIRPETVVDAMLDVAASRRNPVEPGAAELIEHRTAALAAASVAGEVSDFSGRLHEPVYDAAELAEADAMIAAAEASVPAARIGDEYDEADARWRRYRKLAARDAAELADDEIEWMRNYEATPEYRVALEMEKLAARAA